MSINANSEIATPFVASAVKRIPEMVANSYTLKEALHATTYHCVGFFRIYSEKTLQLQSGIQVIHGFNEFPYTIHGPYIKFPEGYSSEITTDYLKLLGYVNIPDGVQGTTLPKNGIYYPSKSTEYDLDLLNSIEWEGQLSNTAPEISFSERLANCAKILKIPFNTAKSFS